MASSTSCIQDTCAICRTQRARPKSSSASLTADQHISKGTHRPHVPQELRAANLAAFEMVDYVIIDKNATPIENLKLIQPDFFAKGYEYGARAVNPRPPRKWDDLHSLRGEMLFTPGDIVSFVLAPHRSGAAGDPVR